MELTPLACEVNAPAAADLLDAAAESSSPEHLLANIADSMVLVAKKTTHWFYLVTNTGCCRVAAASYCSGQPGVATSNGRFRFSLRRELLPKSDAVRCW